MSIIATSNIFLKSEFTSYESAQVTQSLCEICKDVEETRKGRHWKVLYEIEDQTSGFSIHVYKTDSEVHSYIFEDDLIELEIDEDQSQYPEVISIVSNTGREIDKESCAIITDKLSVLFDCVARVAGLSS